MLLLSPPEEEEPQGSSKLDIYHGKMMACLRTIKRTFNPRGRITDKELWTWMPPDKRQLAGLVLEYEESIQKLYSLDENTLPGWDELENWIEKADQIHHQRMHYYRNLATICGQEVGKVSCVKDLRMQYLESPAFRAVMRTYGPHWQEHLPGILRSYSASCTSLSNLIPLEKCRELAEQRTGKILRAWEKLKRQKEEGAVDAFVEVWSRLDRSARSSWLRSGPGVWDIPHQDIYTWAEGSQADFKRLGSGLFLTSFLNAEDLSRHGYLPALLESRIKMRPQLFREFDSRSVAFGLYAEALPVLRCEGRMNFTRHLLDEHTYEVEIVDPNHSNWNGSDPCNGLLSLEAQIRIYEFCGSCTISQISGHASAEEEMEKPSDDNRGTLLDRCYAPDFHNPDMIDLRYIKNLLQACLDEAHDDLWQLRMHEDFWLQRMREVNAERSASNVLLSVFGRIDTFTALRDLVDDGLTILDPDAGDSIRSQLKGLNEAHAIMSLEAALLSAQNDILSAARHVRRPRGDTTPPLERLLKLLTEDSPLIRIMGLPHVMRVIDREMRAQKEARYSFALIQTVNDLAVIAFTLNQVCQYDLFPPPSLHDHFQKLDELDSTWKSRSRPWHNLIQMSLDELEPETLRKLDVLWTRENLSLEERHFQFWTIVDQRIEEMSWQVELQYSSLLETLRQTKPARPVLEKNPFEPPLALPDTEPTLTAKQRGKRRAQSIVLSPKEVPTAASSTMHHDPRPIIPVPMGIVKAWVFWHNLIDGGPECPKEFSWLDFVASMTAIGYGYETTTGSVYRFEYVHGSQRHAINFHRPHGNVLGVIQARRQWRDRILRRVRLELVED